MFERLRGALLAQGRDATPEFSRADALVIAPHPDDETLGCGATIMRKVDAGRRVRVVIVTDGRRSHQSDRITPEELARVRASEAEAACAALGVSRGDLVLLSFEDGCVAESEGALRSRLAEIVGAFAPEQILSPSGVDRHPDHRTIARVVRAMRSSGEIRCPVYEYPIWFWTAGAWMDSGYEDGVEPDGRGLGGLVRLVRGPAWARENLQAVLVSTEGYLDRKRAALAAHRSQVSGLSGEEEWKRLPESFVSNFFQSHEMFFEVGDGAGGAERSGEEPGA